jgi:hypothetical protein
MAGLMSVVSTLASSPIGKIAGGYMEGKLDKAKEARRIQEKKDDRYAAITDSVVTGLIGIDANLISSAVQEDELYKQAIRWATGKFGSYGKGLYWAEQMLHDGAFEGAKSFQEVLNYSAKTYGANLPEGAEPWWKQPEYIEHATKYEDLYKVPSTFYQDRISKSKTNISNILADNGIGDNTFQLFTGAEPGKIRDEQPGKLIETPADQEVSQVSTVDTGGEIVERATLPTTFPSITQRGIVGFDNSTFTKQIKSFVDLQYPDIQDMFILDRNGQYNLNKAAFAADMNKYNEVKNMYDFVNRTLTEVNNAYTTGTIRGSDYSDFEQFYNPKDFNEMGFVQKVLDDYSSVMNGQKAEIIKTNILRQDLETVIEEGTFPTYLLADLSNKLDEAFDAEPGSSFSWENLYLNNVGLEDSSFRRLYNETVNAYFSEKFRLGNYKHNMLFVNPDDTMKDVLGNNIPDWATDIKEYLTYFKNIITTNAEHDVAGTISIDELINTLVPENYKDLLQKKTNLGISEPIVLEPRIVEDPPSEDMVQFNVSNIAKFKLDKVDAKPIEGLSEVAGIILATPSIQTSADVYTFIDQNNQDIDKMKQQIMGFIINDMIDGNLPQMGGLQISDVADQVLVELGTFIEDSYESSEKILEENITDAVTSENQEVIDKIIKEDESSSDILSATLQKGNEPTGEGDEPWLFDDGSFNPDWKGKLEGSNLIKGTQANRYYIDKKVYERKEQAKKDLETKKKQEKTKENIKNIFGETFNWLKENAILEEGEKWSDK